MSKQNMTKELSTDIITHSLKIEWIGVKFIDRKFAEIIFKQLTDPNSKVVTIANPKTLTYIQKYKNEVTLLELDEETKDTEYYIYVSWLSEAKKQAVRDKLEQRKKDWFKTSKWALQEIINTFK